MQLPVTQLAVQTAELLARLIAEPDVHVVLSVMQLIFYLETTRTKEKLGRATKLS